MEYNVLDEGIKNKERFTHPPRLDKQTIEDAIRQVLKKIDANLYKYVDQFPSVNSFDLKYKTVDNVEWTCSFWTGMLWLAYEVTEDEKYLEVAKKNIESFKKRIEEKIETDTHDLGFLYTLSCVPAYKLTGDKEAREIALKAAEALYSRYNEKAKIIQAWGDLKDPEQQGRMIIDCNMNLPLLYWAALETGDKKYYEAARNHVEQAVKYIVRQDASTFHTYYMDTKTGNPKYGNTHQGFSDDSCWARGQAWGIYGFPLSYIYTKEDDLLDVAKRVTNYFLNRMPEDKFAIGI